ncbi:MAG: GMC family oxidoreductase [Deltaproteobacteria bacterium]|nr:GMC family oxidoreductase [Deltaproteobacteria bacterium]
MPEELVFTGRTRVIAERLVEAAFPAGEQLPAPDAAALLSSVEASLAGNAPVRRAITGLLWWLELRHFAGHGRSFSAATRADRSAFLRAKAGGLLGGNLLRAVSAPFRTAYLLDETNMARMQTRNGVRVSALLDDARWRTQVSLAEQAAGDEEIECDVVVIGTGAGGAAAAYELASHGLAVVMIEEGKYYDRRDFNGKLTEVIPKLYRAFGSTIAIGNTFIAIPIGRSVGGTTTINSGTCLRTPEATLAEWREAGLADFTPENLAPYFELVEEVLKVQPADPQYVGEIGKVIAEGAKRIGMKDMRPLQRNAEGCDGQGLCQFGCPTDAKQSTNISFVPRALERGTFLFTGFRADELIRKDQTVTGIVAHGRNAEGTPITLTVKARATVVGMGTLLTPNFLRANGVKNAWLGNNLSIHPAGVVTAWFPGRTLGNSTTIPQGYGVYDWKDEGLMFEGGTLPFVGHGLLSPLQADDFVRFTERYQQTAYFGLMVKDTSRGKVRRGLSRDLPLITYHMNDADFTKFKRGLDTLARMYFAAGAREVCFPGLSRLTMFKSVADLEAFWATKPKPRHFLVTAYHPLGTARIAAREDRGVCDNAHQVWNTEGLYVMDGSSVPGSLGANPQVTIMAMATRAARMLAEKLSA